MKFQESNYTTITGQEVEFLNFIGPLIPVGLPLMKNVLTAIDKSVLVTLGLTTATAAIDAAIQKTSFGSETTTLIFSDEMKWLIL